MRKEDIYKWHWPHRSPLPPRSERVSERTVVFSITDSQHLETRDTSYRLDSWTSLVKVSVLIWLMTSLWNFISKTINTRTLYTFYRIKGSGVGAPQRPPREHVPWPAVLRQGPQQNAKWPRWTLGHHPMIHCLHSSSCTVWPPLGSV